MEELRKQMRESPLGYFDFLVYLINLSEALKDTSRQLTYLEELILLAPYLSGSLAKKYLLILPAVSRAQRIDSLMRRVMDTRSEGAVDKVFVLAGVSGQITTFMSLCHKQKVRFSMLHDLFMNKAVLTGKEESDYYFRRLPEALTQTDFHQARVILLQKAADFLQTLEVSQIDKYSEAIAGFLSGYPVLHNLLPVWDDLCSRKRSRRRSSSSLPAGI
jgi:hypothetical protein